MQDRHASYLTEKGSCGWSWSGLSQRQAHDVWSDWRGRR
jgi:hypothetical protein